MTGGAEVAKRLREGKGGGIPWLAILDAQGTTLVTGDAPKSGNIGCPVQPEEVAWFGTMIEKTARHLTPEDRAKLLSLLETFAKPLRRPAR